MTARTVGALALAALAATANAQSPGTFKQVGSTLVSAMMMFLGNDENIYILDKAEGNPVEINGHPAWGSVWSVYFFHRSRNAELSVDVCLMARATRNIAAGKATVVDVISNSFCASGFFLPNSSWIALGGNSGISPGPVDYHGPGVDPTYQDVDGRQAIRIVAPCNGDAGAFSPDCQWFDDPTTLHMSVRRWYSTAEALGTGEILIIGGMQNGGYINRVGPNSNDPVTQNNLASNSYEFFPARANFAPSPPSDFLVNAGGLNTYAHAFLMASGKVLLQANVSTILLNTDTLVEEPLPDMPNGVVRVYPGSGGVAVLPLTPANNYEPTVLFCGGTNALNDYEWGGYGGPNCNAWERPASADCQRLTPEPQAGQAAYEQDDDMLEGRTMGQFVHLPDGSMLMINGAKMGTAGYTTQTPEIQRTQDLPFGLSLAAQEVLTPAIYYPDQPRGQRWSNSGLAASTIPRMYHSTAIVLPDASVFVAGSNPNGDVNHTIQYNLPYPAVYEAEIWYPPYWGKQRPQPSGIPTSALTYGGDYFNVTLNNGTYAGASNTAASKAKVVLLRSGFTTHAMSMGQRLLQLNNTYTVTEDGTITLHVSQLPANPNLFTPGPALFFVVVDGVPSIGKTVSVGTGNIGQQPTAALAVLPPVTTSTAKGSDDKDGDGKPDTTTTTTKSSSSSPSLGLIIGAAAGGVAVAVALAALLWFFCRRKSRSKNAYGGSDRPFASQQGFAPPIVTGGMQSQYGTLDSAGYNTPQQGTHNPYGPPAAPFARGSEYNSNTSSAQELPSAQQPRNYDQYGASRIPSNYEPQEDAYGGLASPTAPAAAPGQTNYYDPHQPRR
ncbi:DUF1929-domain-containing protein [Auriculariales sp. MPI-PUGE-AT-0066]|nr:DUF1929-domain-containing protein [Auriculariales sp. MPI-PUGE-AT-0066]